MQHICCVHCVLFLINDDEIDYLTVTILSNYIISFLYAISENRFHINLKCGDDPESNVAFHFNPRFGEEHCTVRNTYVEGNWQEEEREEDSFPFEKKDTFEVVIKVMEEKFMV